MIYDNNILKIDSKLSLTGFFDLLYNFFKFSSDVRLDLHERFDLCTKCANKSSYLNINNGHYRTNQTFIVELGFLGVHSDEDRQREYL